MRGRLFAAAAAVAAAAEPLRPSRLRGFLDGTAELALDDGRTVLIPLLLGDPELGALVHDVGQHGAAQEDHVLAARGVLDAELELLDARGVALDEVRVQGTHLLLHAGRETGEHGGAAGEDDVLVEGGTQVDVGLL